jgi:dTDP-4-dehydrorhamnose 3,5-epimerase
MAKVTQLELKEVLVFEYDSKEDNRGTSYKNFSKQELEDVGISTEFVEETLYCPTKKGTLYGIHFQNHPNAQTKLLYCTKGRGLDFAVDLRHDSKNYKKWICIELSQENKKQIYIPAGFGHAFLSLEDDTNVVMRIDNYFDATLTRAIAFNDTELNIDFNILNPILSEMDRNAPTMANCDCNL